MTLEKVGVALGALFGLFYNLKYLTATLKRGWELDMQGLLTTVGPPILIGAVIGGLIGLVLEKVRG